MRKKYCPYCGRKLDEPYCDCGKKSDECNYNCIFTENGFSIVKKNSKYAIYNNKTNKLITDFDYEMIYDHYRFFDYGFVVANTGLQINSQVIIDRNGNEISERYSNINPYFEEGYAEVEKSEIVSARGYNWKRDRIVRRYKGVIDMKGNIIGYLKYDLIDFPVENRRIVTVSEGTSIDRNRNWGWLNLVTGKELLFEGNCLVVHGITNNDLWKEIHLETPYSVKKRLIKKYGKKPKDIKLRNLTKKRI